MDFEQRKFSAWLRRHGRARSTAEAYCTSVRLYFEGGYRWTFDDACRWKEEEMRRVKPATVNIRIHAVNAFAEYSRVRWRLKPVKLQNQQFVENQLSVAQYERFLQCLLDDGNLRWWAAIKILACTGVRISEFLQIKREDLKVGYVDVCGKGTKYRRVWFGSKLRQEVLSTYKEDGPILPYNTGVIRKRLHAFARKYKLPKEPLHPHEFRAFYARRVYEKCHDLKFLQDLLGHADIKTTVRYLRKTSKGISRRISQIVTWWGISGRLGGVILFKTDKIFNRIYQVIGGYLSPSGEGYAIDNMKMDIGKSTPTGTTTSPSSISMMPLLRIAWGISGSTTLSLYGEYSVGSKNEGALTTALGESKRNDGAWRDDGVKLKFNSSKVSPTSEEVSSIGAIVQTLIRIAWGINGHLVFKALQSGSSIIAKPSGAFDFFNSASSGAGLIFGDTSNDIGLDFNANRVAPTANEILPTYFPSTCLLRIAWEALPAAYMFGKSEIPFKLQAPELFTA